MPVVMGNNGIMGVRVVIVMITVIMMMVMTFHSMTVTVHVTLVMNVVELVVMRVALVAVRRVAVSSRDTIVIVIAVKFRGLMCVALESRRSRVQISVALQKQTYANGNDSHTREESEPGVELFWKNVLGSIQRYQAQQENSQGMCDRHDRSQKNCVLGGAATSH